MQAADDPCGGWARPASSTALVLALTSAMMVSYCDRYALNLVIEPIKQDLGLSDTALALLQGFAFSIFFVASGLPLGMLVDRTRRLTVIAAGVLLWSAATCAFGLVNGFGGLLACRVMVAVGEATLSPAAFSIFADAVPRRRLGLAAGIFSIGVYLGAGLAFLGGALFLARVAVGGIVDLPLIGHLRGWRALFILTGLAGLPIALWIGLLREPPRRGASRDGVQAAIADVLAFVREHRRAFALLFLCAGFAAATSQAYAAWMPSHLVRRFGWSVPQAGGLSGLMIITGGLAGVLVAGLLGDALRLRGLLNGRVFVMIGSAAIALPPSVAAPLVASAPVALGLMAISMLATTVLLTSAAPAVQELVPNRMQGTIIALYALVITLVGLGLGPTSVALATNFILHDERRVGASLAFISSLATVAALLTAWSALKPYAFSLSERE